MEKSTFGKRMESIMKERGISRAKLNDATGISLQSISNYLNDKRKPDCEWIVKIAEALGVSADYLLGLSDIPTRNETIQGIHEETGLSEEAVLCLMANHADCETSKSKFPGHEGLLDLLAALIIHGGYAGIAYCEYQEAKANYVNKKGYYQQMKENCASIEMSEQEFENYLQSKMKEAEFKVLLAVAEAIQMEG